MCCTNTMDKEDSITSCGDTDKLTKSNSLDIKPGYVKPPMIQYIGIATAIFIAVIALATSLIIIIIKDISEQKELYSQKSSNIQSI